MVLLYYWYYCLRLKAPSNAASREGRPAVSAPQCGSTRRLDLTFQARQPLYRTGGERNPSCLLFQATGMKTNSCVFTFCLDTEAGSGSLCSNPGFPAHQLCHLRVHVLFGTPLMGGPRLVPCQGL